MCHTDAFIEFLKAGSWSFKGIIILLTYFLNCRRALFTKKNKQVSVKSIELKVLDQPFCEGFPNSAAHAS